MLKIKIFVFQVNYLDFKKFKKNLKFKLYNIIYMSENNLKLWTCYPKNKSVENFENSSASQSSEVEETISETYEHATEDFTDSASNGWECVPTNSIEKFEDVDSESESESESNNSIEKKIKSFKKSVFGDGEYADYYFYASIVGIVFVLILLMRR